LGTSGNHYRVEAFVLSLGETSSVYHGRFNAVRGSIARALRKIGP
jgi:hypothetical protein